MQQIRFPYGYTRKLTSSCCYEALLNLVHGKYIYIGLNVSICVHYSIGMLAQRLFVSVLRAIYGGV